MSNAASVAHTQHNQPPLLLFVAANWWPLSARLAAAFIEHGCEVAAVCPPGHPLRYLHGLRQIRTLRTFASRRSVEQAMECIRPDLVVPCDDCSVAQLHELHRLRPHLRALIERSLGEPHGFEVLESRGKLLECAHTLGIRIAHALEVSSEAQAAERFASGSPTVLLKSDGTSGGEGVKLVRSGAELREAFRRMRSRSRLSVAIKRVLINHDPMALWTWSRWRRRTALTLQQFIRGTPANIMVACWRGRILAEVAVRVLTSQGPTGASLVVQLIENPQLSRAARLLAERLQLSGFFGLDFILEEETGAEYLIEMNPRCTQLGHLKLSQGDLAGALCAALGARKSPRSQPIVSDTIAFFPQAFRWGAPSAFLAGVHQDVPWEQQRLVKVLLRDPWPERRWIARLYHLVRTPERAQAVDSPIRQLDDSPAVQHVSSKRRIQPDCVVTNHAMEPTPSI